MNWKDVKDTVFPPGWWKWALAGLACGMLFRLVCGCSSPLVSEPAYPEYDKWWSGGDVVVHESVWTNDVVTEGADGRVSVERGVVATNRVELMLL